MKVVQQFILRTKSKKTLKKILRTLKSFLYIIVLLLFCNASGFNGDIPLKHMVVTDTIKIDIPDSVYSMGIREKALSNLNKEVEKFMFTIAPDTKLSSSVLVKKCTDYDMDIVFVLAQGLVESHFGTKGKAKETNSVWNVGALDDGRILYTYPTANESIEPYLKLVRTKYLTRVTESGDTIYKDITHLLKDKGYINYQGKRYASAHNYENMLRTAMVKIYTETSISLYQSILKMPDKELLYSFNVQPDINNDEN